MVWVHGGVLLANGSGPCWTHSRSRHCLGWWHGHSVQEAPSGHLQLGLAVLVGVIACWVATFFLTFP